jgi:hypothetical protein
MRLSPSPRERFQAWMLIPVVAVAIVFLVAALGAKKVMCAIEGGHYDSSSNTCFVPE